MTATSRPDSTPGAGSSGGVPPDRPAVGLLPMAAPLVVSFWMRSLFTFVDTVYASTLGDASVAAIGLSIPFEFLFIAVWVGLSNGLTANLARAMGAREGAKVSQHLRAGWRMVITAMPAFASLGVACWGWAGWLAPTAEVAREFAIYGSVLIGGSALTMFWSIIPDSIVKAHGDTRATMWAGIWSNLVNVGLNTLFTFVLHWGIFGIAFSTVLGRLAGLAYALRKASAHEADRVRRGSDTVPGLDPKPYHSQLSLAAPAAAAFTLMALETGIINNLLKHLPSATEAIAAYAIHYRVLQFVMMPAIATSVAMLPYAARRFGQRDLAGIRLGLRQAHLAGLAYVVLAAPLLYAVAAPISAALSDSPLTREFATLGIRLIPLACIAALPMFLCRPVFEALGRGGPGLLVALLRYVVFTAPAAWAGIRLATASGAPGFLGLLLGLIAAATVASAVILGWVRAALRDAAERAARAIAQQARAGLAGG